MSVTLSSQRFPFVKELKNILIGPFEFVYYQHAIHSVKLTKIVGVESSWCNLVLAPPPPPPPPPPHHHQKITSYAPVQGNKIVIIAKTFSNIISMQKIAYRYTSSWIFTRQPFVTAFGVSLNLPEIIACWGYGYYNGPLTNITRPVEI